MRLYFASAGNSDKDRRLTIAGVKNRLTSYYQFDGSLAKGRPSLALAIEGKDQAHLDAVERSCERAMAVILKHREGNSWVIDSGAHTYQQPKYRVPEPSLRAYADRYIEFCKKADGVFDWCAELDVEEGYGMSFVEEVWDKMVDAGLPALRVWHKWRGVDAWVRYCNESEYVGIGGPWDMDHFIPLVKHAYRNGNRVHFFGVSDHRLRDAPVWSSDSASWLEGEAYAQVTLFSRERGNVSRVKVGRNAKKTQPVDLENLSAVADYLQLGYEGITYKAIEQLLRFEEMVTRSWEVRGVNFRLPGFPSWVPKCEDSNE